MYGPDQFQRLTLAKYRRMLELGILTPADQVELLEGLLVQRQSHPAETAVTTAIRELLAARLPVGWGVHTCRAIPLAGPVPESQPEPDLTVARCASADHSTDIIGEGKDIGVVVELAGSFPGHERVEMGRIYSRASIPVYWVVVPAEKVIEVYTLPTGSIDSPHYAKRDRYPVGAAVPVVLDGNTVGTVAVAEVMG